MSEEKKTRFSYPLRDSINDKIDAKRMQQHAFGDDLELSLNEALDEDVHVFQQSFLGLSIIDFTASLGFNSSASNLSVNLIQDDTNFLTPLSASGFRDAVTEGYHPWDRSGYPKELINGAGECKGGGGVDKDRAETKDEEFVCTDANGEVVDAADTEEKCSATTAFGGECPVSADPCTWSNTYNMSHEMGVMYEKNGDVECFPRPGSPVFFKYYDGQLLEEECILKEPGNKDFCKNVFAFGGLLSRWEKQYSTSGFTYSVTIADPREILENTIIILDGYAGRTAPADKYNIKGANVEEVGDPNTDDEGVIRRFIADVDTDADAATTNILKVPRGYEAGWNGYYNIINVYGYYETHGFGFSNRTDLGMKWYDDRHRFKSQYFGIDENGKSIGYSHAHGILPALRLMLSGRNDKYITDLEPFGGPLYYGIDNRNVEEAAPLAEGEIKDEAGNVKEEYNVHRYVVDLDDLIQLSVKDSKEDATDVTEQTGKPRSHILPNDFHIEGDRVSLLQLVQQVCDSAGVDFQVRLLSPAEAERHAARDEISWGNHLDEIKNYSGIIKVVPLIKKEESDEEGIIRKSIDDSQKTSPEGPFVFRNQSTLVSASIGREFADPITGQVLLGAPRTRMVGVTPLGDRKTRRELWFNMQSQKYNDKTNMQDDGECKAIDTDVVTGHATEADCLADKDDDGNPLNYWTPHVNDHGDAPIEGRDDILREFLPSIEMDGVTLRNQKVPLDDFEDRSSLGWNPYGTESRKEFLKKVDPESFENFEASEDFKKNLPPVSNDDYLPWHWPPDYSGDTNKEANPFELNRVNSKLQATRGRCTDADGEDGYFCADIDCDPDKEQCSPYETDADGCLNVDGCLASGYADKTSCEAATDHTWVLQGSNLDDACACSDFGGQWISGKNQKVGCKSKSGNTFNKSYSDDSGYLDMFPCWGFKERTFTEHLDGLFDDIIEIKQTGKPIKGFFWDDDPYRDFHPTDGIFGVMEFVNPGLGECILENAGGTARLAGDAISAFKNQKDICECDPSLNAGSECQIAWQTADLYEDYVVNVFQGFQTKWRPACLDWAECRDSDGAKIEELHAGIAGTGNNLVGSKYGCEQGCFNLTGNDPNGEPTGNPIVLYYLINTQTNAGEKRKGDPANINDFADIVDLNARLAKKEVAFIESGEDCKASGIDRGRDFLGNELEDLHRGSFPINSGGTRAEEGKGNSHSGGGGFYAPECKAISTRYDWGDCCKAIIPITDGKGNVVYPVGSCTESITAQDCIDNEGGKANWFHAPVFPDSDFVDGFTGEKIPANMIPTPGYIQVRLKTGGTCHENTTETVDGKEVEKQTEVDISSGPEEIRTLEQICYGGGGVDNRRTIKYDGAIPIQPRTATIPIDLSEIGFRGGPVAETNGPNGEFSGFYYTTVTELRHAAVSKDSWMDYIREIQSFLPCYMFSQDPVTVNKWKDMCATAGELVLKGGKSNAHVEALSALSRLGNALNPKPLTETQLFHAGRQNWEDALAFQGHICGDDPTNASMTIAQRTSMQVDLAYKKIKDIATQYYGRKYLVPLPFNPPTAVTCSSPKYEKRKKCQESGYDWGSHGLISSWFKTFGLGLCVDTGGKEVASQVEKLGCEGAGHVWIEPVQEKNRWEIISAAWPGGDITTKFDRQDGKITGYPQNMNFWTDDGNLKSFVIFPERDVRRFAGDAGPNEMLSFSGWDAEQVHVSHDKNMAGPDAAWGAKVFATTEVDPKTHWLPVRPDWEIQHEKQYYKFRAGDGGGGAAPPDEKNHKEDENGNPIKDENGNKSKEERIKFAIVGPDKIFNGECTTESEEEDGDPVVVDASNEEDCKEIEGASWKEDRDSTNIDITERLNQRSVFLFDEVEYECKDRETGELTENVCMLDGEANYSHKTEDACVAQTGADGEAGEWVEMDEDKCKEIGKPEEGKESKTEWKKKEKKRIEHAAYKPYALITLPAQVYYGNIDRARKLHESLGGAENDMCIPLTAGRGRNALLAAWFEGKTATDIATQQLIAFAANSRKAGIVAPDLLRNDFIAAAYKPWHAAVPQQSTHYKWGPWSMFQTKNYGKPSFEIDEQMHPAAFNGETALSKVAITRLSATLAQSQTHIESGSVTLTGFGHLGRGSCDKAGANMEVYFNKQECEENGGVWLSAGENYLTETSGAGLGDQFIGVGPFVTDINVSIGTGGVNVTYNLSTQKKFGQLEKLQENRIKQTQKDILRSRVAGENQLKRVKRGIDQYRK